MTAEISSLDQNENREIAKLSCTITVIFYNLKSE